LEIRLSRTALLSALAVGAFATTFGVVELLKRQSMPPGILRVTSGDFTMGEAYSALAWPGKNPGHRDAREHLLDG
jgi:hypothetical protein